MNGTLKEVTVNRYQYNTHAQIRDHLYTFLDACKTLHRLTAYEYMLKCWQKEPERFRMNPAHHIVGLTT